MMRPSGSWSKPIGSFRFGGAEILVCWIIGEHGRAAVAVDRVGLAGRPLDRAAEVLAEVGLAEAAAVLPPAGVERAPALVVLAPDDRVIVRQRRRSSAIVLPPV